MPRRPDSRGIPGLAPIALTVGGLCVVALLLWYQTRADSDPVLRFRAEVTAYTSSTSETSGDPLITASGQPVGKGVAACPRKFPFGTRIRIDGNVYVCWDRPHERFDERFDIWMSSQEEAIEFGRQQLDVEVW